MSAPDVMLINIINVETFHKIKQKCWWPALEPVFCYCIVKIRVVLSSGMCKLKTCFTAWH